MVTPQTLERGQSWPQSAAGHQYQTPEDVNSPTHSMRGPFPHDYRSSHSSLQLCQPQYPTSQCTPYVPQRAEPHNSALTRYSLDSALAASAHSAIQKANQPKPTPSIPGFFTQHAQQLAQSIFGENYVAETATETFYIGEKPSSPQRDDGLIRMPDLDHPGKFQDSFKVDMTGHWITLRER